VSAEAGVTEDACVIRCKGVDSSMLLSAEAGDIEDPCEIWHAVVESSFPTSGLCASDRATVEDAPSICLSNPSPGDRDAERANAFKLSVPVGVRGVDGAVKLHKLSDASLCASSTLVDPNTTVEDAPSTCLRSPSPGDGDAERANAFELSVPVGVRGVDGAVKLHKLSDSSLSVSPTLVDPKTDAAPHAECLVSGI